MHFAAIMHLKCMIAAKCMISVNGGGQVSKASGAGQEQTRLRSP
jgi:hypothetical protein